MSTKMEKPLLSDGDQIGLTQTLRVLTERTTERFDPSNPDLGRKGALLACSDKSAQRWGTRWLVQSNFEVVAIADPQKVLEFLETSKPDVVIVDASICMNGGNKLFQEIQAASGDTIPVFVICSSTQETNAAIDAGAYDVARKPVDWQVLCRRAKNVVNQNRRSEELLEARASLKAALELANRARQMLRTSEAFEPVTGLPNRAKFIDLVSKGILAAQRDGNNLAVFVLVFRRFRMVLEALGKAEANAVVAEIAQRLNHCVRVTLDSRSDFSGLKTAAISNIGIGKFAIMLTSSRDQQEARALAREILTQLSAPTVVGGQTIYLTTTTGAANFPDAADNAEVLLIKAEAAMREAHAKGAAFQQFVANTDAAAARRLKIEQRLHQALDNGELRLAYQPISDVMTDRLVGVEALLRWPQLDPEEIGPAEFVPIAEEAGLINRIGAFAIDEACRQLRIWRNQGLTDMSVAVNVARGQLLDRELTEVVAQSLRRYKIMPWQLDLEISERGVLTGNKDVVEQLFQLKSLGVTISIDDFGTGDSSLAYLKDMPIDTLKIDRTYIALLGEDGRESRMIAAMVALAEKLELKVVAEGVELQSQLNILQSLGCDYYQGFLRSPPIWPDEIIEFASPRNP
ncbi:MAG: EAL domain-containing protein [Gammaproteobacteria bacterium]|nr:EAL domain-containing protein [Gammaproteobacteria bacterium]